MFLADHHAWIFVSHSSQDLAQVRVVRNYLEAKAASPLLFHLRALEVPEEFWPLIEREIHARNFFLYCESESAAASQWVQRERAAVEALAKKRPVRIGSIRVDTEIDRTRLDDFLSTTRVFPSYARRDLHIVKPFLEALVLNGFEVFRDYEMVAGGDLVSVIRSELNAAAERGWVIVFLSRASLDSEWVKAEMLAAIHNRARIVPVMLERVPIPELLRDIAVLDVSSDLWGGPLRLVAALLRR